MQLSPKKLANVFLVANPVLLLLDLAWSLLGPTGGQALSFGMRGLAFTAVLIGLWFRHRASRSWEATYTVGELEKMGWRIDVPHSVHQKGASPTVELYGEDYDSEQRRYTGSRYRIVASPKIDDERVSLQLGEMIGLRITVTIK